MLNKVTCIVGGYLFLLLLLFSSCYSSNSTEAEQAAADSINIVDSINAIHTTSEH